MAKARRDNKVALLGVVRRNRPALMMSTALQATAVLVLSLPAHAQPAPNAHPIGGSVVAGAAAISRSASNTQINQSSPRAAINWQSFDVGSKQSVTFQQPSSGAVALNRVTGPDPSQIAGRINANGQVVLINQSGVNFYQGAQVNTAGLIVTTANMTDTSFMAGSTTFDQPGKPNARITNAGTITVRQAGLAALVAPQVANSGVITAKLGHVVLAGAKTATLDLYGDGLLSLDVTNQVTQAPGGPDGKPVTALVTNTGVIAADGGTVQLTARAADGIVQDLVEAGGKVRAATVGNQTGVVALNGVGGSIVVTGQLAAPGRAPGTRGGDIEVVSDGNVTAAPGAKIEASGKAGGGVVSVGTTLDRAKGGPSVTPTLVAANTVIQKGATITANAAAKGTGGRITVLSAKSTSMAGSISAKGGPDGGNGGSVEVSGNDKFSLTGAIDVSAPSGTDGTILLDPATLEIINGAAGSGKQDVAPFTTTGTISFATADTTPNTVSNGQIESFGGTILLEATNSITVDPSTPIVLKSGAGLILQTNTGDISVGAGSPITASGNGFLTFEAGLTAGSGGKITLGSDLGADSAGGEIRLQADGGINLGTSKLTAAVVDLGNITSGGASGGVVRAGTLQSSVGVRGDATLTSASNSVGTLGGFAVTNGDFSLVNNGNPGNLVIAGSLTGTNVTLRNANTGTITVTGSIGATTDLALSSGSGGIALNTGHILSGATVDLSATGGGVTQVATGTITASTLLRSSSGVTGTVKLAGTTNNIATLGSFALNGGDFSLVNTGNTGNFNVAGPVSAANLTINDANTGTISVAGSIGASGTTSLNAFAINLSTGATIAGPTVQLNAATGGITFTGNAAVGQAGGVVDITSGGVVNEATTGIITAGTLQSSGGIAGNATFLGTNNAIGNLGNIPIALAGLALDDGVALTVAGTVTAPGQVYLQSSAGAGISIAATGSVGAGSLATFQADALTNAGTVTGSKFEWAPATEGNQQPLATLVHIPDNDRIGAVTLPGAGSPATTAGSIVVRGNFGDASTNLELDSLGGISESGGAITASTLTGNAGATVNLSSANTITMLNSFAVTGGTFNLTDGGNLKIANTLTADGITIADSGALTVSGNLITAGTASLSAASIDIADVGLVNGGSVALFGTVGAITETGTLIAGTLSGSAVGAANLTGATATTNQIGTLGNFAAAGLTLDDGEALTVAGTLSGSNVTMLDNGTLTIALSGDILENAIDLTANDITIAGRVFDSGGTTHLVATTGAISQTGDEFISGTLSGSAATTASLTGGGLGLNLITNLGSFTAESITLNDNAALNVVGPVTASKGVMITDSSILTVTGTVAPPSGITSIAVALQGLGIDVDSAGVVSDGGSGTTSLVSSGGAMFALGTLIAGTLSGSATSGDTLDLANVFGASDTANQIRTLGSFTASELALRDGVSLNVAGPVTVGTSLLAIDSAALTVTGIVAPPTGTSATEVALQAATIDMPGLVSAGANGMLSLLVNAGTVSETGTFIAGTLFGTAAAAASLTGTAFSNQIGTLVSFTAGNGITLDDGIPLTVGASVFGGPSLVIRDKGALAITGSASATAVSLTADSINISGIATDGGAGTVALVASTGSIGETGTLIAGTLSGSAATTASLIGTGANQVANLGDFTATDLTLSDSVSLNVKGTVTARNSTTIADAGSLLVSGTIAPPDGANSAVSLMAPTIDVPGMVSDGGAGTTSMIATTGTILETGALIAGTLSGSSPGSTSLTGTIGSTANRVAALGDFSASAFTLNDSGNLTIAGTVAGGPSVFVADLSGGGITVAGTVTGSAIELCCGNISIPGMVSDGGAGTVALFSSGGGINETGTLIAGTLELSTFLPGATLMGATPAANQIAVLADSGSSGLLAFTGGPLNLRDGRDLLISGNVSDWTTISIIDAGNLAIAGTLGAFGDIALSANSIGMLGVIGAPNSVSLTATAGAIIQAGGTLTAGTLTGSAAGAASLTQAVNQIGTVNNFTASGLTLDDAADLTISGNVNGGPNVTLVGSKTITIAAGGTLTGSTLSAIANGNFAIAGTVQDASSINLVSSTASISETGALVADLLTGSAAADASLIGAPGSNRVARLGAFSAGGTFALNDATGLTILGPLSAPRIVINSGASMLTLANQAVISTGGVTRPPGTLQAYPGDPGTAPANGAYLATGGGFTQQGSSSITGLAGGPSVLRINATGDANINFDPVKGLQGKDTWLILSVETGKASGLVDVKNLDVIRIGDSGSTNLTGTVAGLTGPAAAGVSGIQPGPNPNFRFNQCPIHSVSCVLFAAEGVPVANPLNDIYFGSLFNPNDEEDLLLPIVSDQDY